MFPGGVTIDLFGTDGLRSPNGDNGRINVMPFSTACVHIEFEDNNKCINDNPVSVSTSFSCPLQHSQYLPAYLSHLSLENMAFSIQSIGNIIFILAALTPSALAICQWGSLRQMTDTYIESQTFGELDPSLLPKDVIYKENNKVVDIKKGLLSNSLKVDYSHTIVDQTQCATYTKLVVADAKNPYVIGTQLSYNDTDDAELTTRLVDVIVTTTGDSWFDAAQTLDHVQAEDWSSLAREDQDTREALRAIADAYLDLWSNSTNVGSIPWGRPCSKLEGSRFTADSCTAGLSLPEPGAGQPNTNRRYVIDESVGAVNVFCEFGSLGNAPDSHEFRIVGGKLYYVHQLVAAKS